MSIVVLIGKEEERQMFQQMQAMAQKQVFRKLFSCLFFFHLSTSVYEIE